MKKLTQIVVGTLIAIALTTSAIAADTTVKAKANTPVVVQTIAAPSTSLFNAGEVGLRLGSSYTLDTSAPFKQAYGLNFNAGAFYFPWRNVGVEANVPFYQTKGVSVDEIQAGLLVRLPLSKTKTFLKNIAPYVGVGPVYNWQTDNTWAYIAKVGVDYRLNKKWGIFVEEQYRNSSFSNFERGQNTLTGGLKFVF